MYIDMYVLCRKFSLLLSECIESAVDDFGDYSEITLLVETIRC